METLIDQLISIAQSVKGDPNQKPDELKASIDALCWKARSNPLTGGLSRADLDRLVKESAKESDQTGKPFAIIMFDADDLKETYKPIETSTRAGDVKKTIRLMKAFVESLPKSEAQFFSDVKPDPNRRADAIYYGDGKLLVLITGLPCKEVCDSYITPDMLNLVKADDQHILRCIVADITERIQQQALNELTFKAFIYRINP